MGKNTNNTEKEFRKILTKEEHSLVSSVSGKLDYQQGIAMAFCVELLYNVNSNDAAELVMKVLAPIFDERNNEYVKNVIKLLDNLESGKNEKNN